MVAWTFHEKTIADLYGNNFGATSLFKPNLYGPNKNEPADIAWVADRCAILMYLCNSKQKFIKKKQHNSSQLHRWLKAWKNGRELSGSRGEDSWSFRWSDIDHVIGILVVDGENSFCQYHQDDVKYSSNYKLKACVTLTGEVVDKFAKSRGGIRDLLDLMSFVKSDTSRLYTSEEVKDAMIADEIYSSKKMREYFGITNYDRNWLLEGWNSATQIIHNIKSINGLEGAKLLGQNLTRMDALWLGLAYNNLSSIVASPKSKGCPGAFMELSHDQYKIIAAKFSGWDAVFKAELPDFREKPTLLVSIIFDEQINSDLVLASLNEISSPSPIWHETARF